MDCKLDVVVYNHLDIFFGYTIKGTCICEEMIQHHMLVYVLEGEIIIQSEDKRTTFKQGDTFFLRRNHLSRITKQPTKEGGVFKCFKLKLCTSFLKAFVTKQPMVLPIPKNPKNFDQPCLLLPQHAALNGLLLSLRQYSDTQTYPSEELMELKLTEAVLVLLQIESRLAGALFDFAEPWKIDLVEFMNKNYKCDLSLNQFANFTGRSLTTFKRDFERLFGETPSRWIVRKRLKEAHHLIKTQNDKPSDVYLEVGFKNLSHFSTAFKKEFGHSPRTHFANNELLRKQ